ncbi:MAG: hypothetical protein OER88_11625 [Planctomycetota bacterium]|nr:hypothetical protein [Planctomycetota bacterium]
MSFLTSVPAVLLALAALCVIVGLAFVARDARRVRREERLHRKLFWLSLRDRVGEATPESVAHRADDRA